MGLKTVLYIPYMNFKEKIRLTKKYKKAGYYVEDLDGGIYCLKIDGYKRKERGKNNGKIFKEVSSKDKTSI